MDLKIVIAISAITLLSGCASNYGVTYNSTPQSAMVVCNGMTKGYTPVTLYYPKKAISPYGNLYTEPCQAVWTSGASASFDRNFDTTKFPDGVMNTVQRPNVDGYSTDASMDYQKKANDAALREQQIQNFNQSMQNIQNSRPKTTYCNQYGTQTICNSY